MTDIILIISVGYFLYLFYEKINLEYKRKKIRYVIHVNGTRGKSTVSRLIDAGLRAGGYKVFTKITGTSPRYISTDGIEYVIKRRGKPNIREQIKIFNRAVKSQAEILILECMAVKPELQRICEEKIVKADIGVITNVREDHLDEMGETLEEIAFSLASTIPTDGLFFTGDKNFFDFFKERSLLKNTKSLDLLPLKNEYEKIDFSDNVALALNVCINLGVNAETALVGMKNYKRDPGVLKTIRYYSSYKQEIFFINALAANDPNSSEIILEKLKLKEFWSNKRYLMINNRGDRISRRQQYIGFIKKLEHNFDNILISGEGKEIFIDHILKAGIENRKIIKIQNLDFFYGIKEKSMIFAVGNICGNGKNIVDYLEKVGELYE